MKVLLFFTLFFCFWTHCAAAPAPVPRPQAYSLPPSAQALFKKLSGDVKADNMILGELQLVYPDQPQGMFARAALEYDNDPLDAETPLALVDRALALNPSMNHALALRGELRLKRRQAQEAATDFSDALALGARPRGIYYNRAIAYEMLGDLHRSLRDWAEHVLLDPQDLKAYALGERLFSALKREREANWCRYKMARLSMSWRRPHLFPVHVWNYFKYGWVLDNVDPDLPYISRGEGAAYRKDLEGGAQLVVSLSDELQTLAPKSGLRIVTAPHRTLAEVGGLPKLFAAMAGDLYGYLPSLSDKYSTGRSRQAFERTPAYLAELKKMSDFVSGVRSSFLSFDTRAVLSSYDEDLQGFYLQVGANRGLRAQAHHPANWGGFYIQALPVISLPSAAAEDEPRSYFLFIPADRELRSKLEKAGPKLMARVLVRPDYAGQSPAYKFISTGPDSATMTLTIEDDCITVADAGLLLLNGEGNVLYSQAFY